jgi:hypothetical protein
MVGASPESGLLHHRVGSRARPCNVAAAVLAAVYGPVRHVEQSTRSNRKPGAYHARQWPVPLSTTFFHLTPHINTIHVQEVIDYG